MIEEKDKSSGFGNITSFVRRSLRRSGRGYDPRRSLRKEPLKPIMPKKNFEIVYDSVDTVITEESVAKQRQYPEGNSYEQVEPVWKSYLYQMQLKAPKPHRVVAMENRTDRPSFYGKEYHGPISRVDAEKLVMKREGSYLTRESQRQPGTYALTFRFNDAPKNYRLYFDEAEQTHYVGEKRFETIHDLVADGLITLYMDLNAKDYISHMTLTAQRNSQNKLKERVERRLDDEEDAPSPEIAQENSSGTKKILQNSFKASECAKPHNFKVHSYYGPHWCDLCRNFMWGLKNQGVRCQDCSYDCHKQCSEIVPEDCSPNKKLVKRVFGVDLTTLIKTHNQRRPAVVDACIKEIESRALEMEGIYRVPGFADDINFLQATIDRDGTIPDLTESSVDDINVVCGLLKLYFRQLPIPIITFDLYDQFISASKLSESDEVIKKMGELVNALPPAHYETLKYFCRHLQRVTKYKDKNLMSSENLGIVFGPTLMRAPDSQALQAVGNLQYQKEIIKVLIEDQDILFEK